MVHRVNGTGGSARTFLDVRERDDAGLAAGGLLVALFGLDVTRVDGERLLERGGGVVLARRAEKGAAAQHADGGRLRRQARRGLEVDRRLVEIALAHRDLAEAGDRRRAGDLVLARLVERALGALDVPGAQRAVAELDVE